MKHCLDFGTILSFYDYVILVATYKNLETKQQRRLIYHLLLFWCQINRLPVVKHFDTMRLVRRRENNTIVLQHSPFYSPPDPGGTFIVIIENRRDLQFSRSLKIHKQCDEISTQFLHRAKSLLPLLPIASTTRRQRRSQYNIYRCKYVHVIILFAKKKRS